VNQERARRQAWHPKRRTRLHGKQTGNTEAVAKVKEKAMQRATDLKAMIENIRRSGIASVRAIAEELNRQGVSASRGGLLRVTSSASRENANLPSGSEQPITTRVLADKLVDLGITKTQSSRWQQLADLPRRKKYSDREQLAAIMCVIPRTSGG
jgi:hypothetical protein